MLHVLYPSVTMGNEHQWWWISRTTMWWNVRVLLAWMACACDALGELEQRSCWQGYQGCGLQAEHKTMHSRASLQNHPGSQFKTSDKAGKACWGSTGTEQSCWRLFSKLGMLWSSCQATVPLFPPKSDPSHSSLHFRPRCFGRPSQSQTWFLQLSSMRSSLSTSPRSQR